MRPFFHFVSKALRAVTSSYFLVGFWDRKILSYYLLGSEKARMVVDGCFLWRPGLFEQILWNTLFGSEIPHTVSHARIVCMLYCCGGGILLIGAVV